MSDPVKWFELKVGDKVPSTLGAAPCTLFVSSRQASDNPQSIAVGLTAVVHGVSVARLQATKDAQGVKFEVLQ